MNNRPHMTQNFPDGSVAIKPIPGGFWKVNIGTPRSQAADFMKQQNRFIKPWHARACSASGEYLT